MPQSVLHSLPQSLPHSMHHSMPQSVTHSVQSVPHSVSQSAIQSTPQPVPHSIIRPPRLSPLGSVHSDWLTRPGPRTRLGPFYSVLYARPLMTRRQARFQAQSKAQVYVHAHIHAHAHAQAQAQAQAKQQPTRNSWHQPTGSARQARFTYFKPTWPQPTGLGPFAQFQVLWPAKRTARCHRPQAVVPGWGTRLIGAQRRFKTLICPYVPQSVSQSVPPSRTQSQLGSPPSRPSAIAVNLALCNDGTSPSWRLAVVALVRAQVIGPVTAPATAPISNWCRSTWHTHMLPILLAGISATALQPQP